TAVNIVNVALHHSKRLRRVLLRVLTSVTTVTIVTFVTIYALPAPAASEVPSFDSVKNNWISTEGALLDRHGELIHELRVSGQGRRLAWISLDDISPAALTTIIRAEDKRFYQHHGVDWLAMSDAALDTVLLSQP